MTYHLKDDLQTLLKDFDGKGRVKEVVVEDNN